MYSDILDKLCNKTRDLRVNYKGCSVIWLIHFAPYDCGKMLELKEYKSLMSSADAFGIEYVICGHTHKRSKVLSGMTTVYCASSSCGIDIVPNNEVHLLEFSVKKSSVELVRRSFGWVAREQSFAEEIEVD